MSEIKDGKLIFNEFDSIEVVNPLDEEFTVRFNGQPYKLDAEERRSFPYFLGFHIAKHLSDKMLQPDLQKIKKEKGGNGEFNPKNAQLMVYDNPRRRMTLYEILGKEELVQACIEAFPFKAFIGEMKEWTQFLEKKNAPAKAPAKESKKKSEEDEE